MKDQESVKAGNLTSDHIGRNVSVTWQHDRITSTVTDELVSFTNKGATVVLRFRRTQWRPSLVIGSYDDGLTVVAATLVTIEGGK